jgi:hypothetical protein
MDGLNKGGFFNQYYGTSTREYVARYDRLYFVDPTKTAASSDDDKRMLQVTSFQFIADKPIGNSKRHFLSDHFGVLSRFNIKWSV